MIQYKPLTAGWQKRKTKKWSSRKPPKQFKCFDSSCCPSDLAIRVPSSFQLCYCRFVYLTQSWFSCKYVWIATFANHAISIQIQIRRNIIIHNTYIKWTFVIWFTQSSGTTLNNRTIQNNRSKITMSHKTVKQSKTSHDTWSPGIEFFWGTVSSWSLLEWNIR